MNAPLRFVEEPLYEVRRKIYPRAVTGVFARWRIALVLATQLVFYGLPWLQWNGRQAVLFDLAARKFYIFGMVLWPQDFVYLTALLVLSALALFLFTAVAGRLWCGFACPQTVYTEIFLWIERAVEGERTRRMKLDAGRTDARKLALKVIKHALWIAVALWTGFTFVGYFSAIRGFGWDVLGLHAGPWEAFWMVFYGFATYGNAGWMREQVCKHMCPYARFQSAMFDPDTLIITYDRARGEPRGSRSRSSDPKALGLGDCVDCGICVQACPTGIDIRDGLQYECIGCAACIDGCNQVMHKLGYAPGLIRYTTERALGSGGTGRDVLRRVLRPRVLVYAALMGVIAAGTATTLLLRTPLKVDVIRDRAGLAREMEDGSIVNVYRLQIMNTREEPRRFAVRAAGLGTIEVAGESVFEIGAASSRMVPLKLRVQPGQGAAGPHAIRIEVQALDDPRIEAHERTVFVLP